MIPRRGPVALTVLTAVMAVLIVQPTPATATATEEPSAPQLAEVDLDLTRPVGGARALRLLGSKLPAAAAVNDMTGPELRTLLSTDPTAALATDGSLYFRDRAPASGSTATATTTAAAATSPPAYPLEETFELHSNPGSARTIFLDVDGATVSGTLWNDEVGIGQGLRPAWDPAGDGAAFNADERAMVQEIWARVAEDYAPFDVDVTTEDPGEELLNRDSGGDQTYGLHLLVGANEDAMEAACAGLCGGIAWLNTFSDISSTGYYQTAWVFAGALLDDPMRIAEAASHEAGHTFGLEHDGTSTDEYYDGHGNWAPIMGVGYYSAVTQWSDGSYTDANNHQDDVTIIGSAAHAPVRADEAVGTVEGAAGIPAGTAYISSRDDVDVYDLGVCEGAVTVTATPAPLGPNLDIALQVLTGDGTPFGAETDPPSGQIGDGGATVPVATGLTASMSDPAVPVGTYFVSIRGAGADSYDDYGSLGAYTLETIGCTAPTSVLPSAPTGLVGTGDAEAGTATVSWAAPISDGGSPVTGYESRIDGGSWSASSPATTREFTDLARGPHTVQVRAVNANGPSQPASVTVTLATVPGMVGGITVTTDFVAGTATLSWPEPGTGGSPILDYGIDDGYDLLGWTGGKRTATIEGLDRGATYEFGIVAVNNEGYGPRGVVTVTLTAPPPAPPTPTVQFPRPNAPVLLRPKPGKKGGKVTVVVRWKVPTFTGGLTVGNYRVELQRLDRRGAVTKTTYPYVPRKRLKAEFTVSKGFRYRVRIQARTASGYSDWSAATAPVKGR
ncbi:MAG TPA: hypothetical protein VGE38_09970 [Nocardioides sp.]|uniref:fibronectin type III domain-containing protein n=1 Tax=Nocardioides sp. TaxID=35761 RepID=UPI002ED87CAE